jgi:hypothetical protein
MLVGRLPTVLRIGASAMVAGTLLSCALVMSFDRFDQALFSVGGEVDGLEGSATIKIVLNGARSVQVGNGPFDFPAAVDNGPYAITVEASGYVCSLERALGSVQAASVTDVAVHCSSTDATLAGLALSIGPFAPAFDPATLAYTAGPLRTQAIFSPTTTTVTATARSPRAGITVQGVPAMSGTPSAPVALVGAPVQPIDVTVTAADGKTQVHYAVAASTSPNDYIKASNTRAHALFGTSIALVGDLLAVGAPGDSSNATQPNGNEADTSAPNAGAVYVYGRVNGLWTKQGYVKASNARAQALFGSSVAWSEDGTILAIGSPGESSNATLVNGNPSDTSLLAAGAVYVYGLFFNRWFERAYIKASNTRANAQFGGSIAVSGNTLAVGAVGDSSNATLVNGNATDTSAQYAGAVYVYTYSNSAWALQAYVKASNTRTSAYFGCSVALGGDTLAVGASGDSSGATLVNGNESDTSALNAGAAYVYTRNAGVWTKQAYIKASNTRAYASFGQSLALSGDTLAVGSFGESSGATVINGDESDTSAGGNGAAYVYGRAAGVWTKQAYIKASNGKKGAGFGVAVALSANALVVGARGESSGARFVDGDMSDLSAPDAGAVYVFAPAAGSWTPVAYVKASNTRTKMFFGVPIAISGVSIAIGATQESSSGTLVNGNQADTSADGAGAVYVY